MAGTGGGIRRAAAGARGGVSSALLAAVRPGECVAGLAFGAVVSASWLYPGWRGTDRSLRTGGYLLGLCLEWILVAALSAVLMLVAYRLLAWALSPRGQVCRVPLAARGRGRLGRWLRLELTPRSVVTVAAVILVCWVPWIVLMRPVSMAADTVAQILWARGYPAWDPSTRLLLGGQYVLSDQHPVLDTLIYGLFDGIGRSLGSEAVGYEVLDAIQAALTALAMSATVCYLRGRFGVPKPLCWAFVAFYALVPAFGCMTQVMVKDLTSMPFFMAWALLYVELVVRGSRGREITPRLVLWLVVLGVLGALMRKTLLYIEVGALVLAFLFLAARRRLVLPILVPVLVVQVLLARIVFPLAGVSPSGAQELLAVPLQQTAYTVLVHGDEMSEEDLETIDRVLDVGAIAENYSATSSDSVKDVVYRHDCTAADRVAWLGVWLRQALSYPDSYVGAVSYLRAFFVPGMVASEGFPTRSGWPEYGGNDILPEYPAFSYDEPAPQTNGQALCQDVVFATFPSVPVIGMLGQCVTYYLWLPLFSLFACLLRRGRTALLSLAPLALSWAVLLVCCAAQARYGYDLLYCMPLVLCLPFVPWHSTDGAPRATRSS